MKTSRFTLFAIVTFTVISIGFSACVDGGNKQTFSYAASIVIDEYSSSVPGIPFMNTNQAGLVAIPELKGKFSSGQCLYTTFEIDYDNQPTSAYHTATNVGYVEVGNGIFYIGSGSMKDSYADSIVTIANDVTFAMVDKTLFMVVVEKAAKAQQYDCELICNTDSTDKSGTEEVYSLYLRSKKTNTATGTESEIGVPKAFDLRSFMNNFGSGKEKLSFLIKFKSGTDANGNDIYTSWTGTEPILIAIPKEE